jgi:hypothetical protein
MTSLPYIALVALLAPLALAAPPASEIARAELALQLLERAQHEGKDITPMVRQLFFGQDDYAPWEMPCPSDYTWIRPADVSITRRILADCRAWDQVNPPGEKRGNQEQHSGSKR